MIPRPVRAVTWVVAMLGLGVGCAADPTGGLPPGDAQLAILHAADPVARLALLLDGEEIGLPAPGTRGSLPISDGPHQLALRGSNGLLLATTRFTAPAGMRVVVVVQQTINSQWSLQVATDPGELATAGDAGIRVVQSSLFEVPLAAWLAPDDGDLLRSEVQIATSTAAGQGRTLPLPGFTPVTPGDHRLVISVPGFTGDAELLTVPVTLERGAAVTVVIVPGVDRQPLVWLIRET